jgi:carboxymethylenebutenolidase
MQTSPPADIRETTDTLRGSGRPMRVERFEPPDAAAAAIILHGADGLLRRGPTYRALAHDLVRRGFRVFLPHYFECTGTAGHALTAQPADAVGWLAAVGEVADRARGVPVGLVGFSLGGYLAVAAAGQDERVGAVVECFGGLPDFAVGEFARMPPVLILHGEADPVVPVSEAHRLAAWLAARGTPHQLHVYAGLGHSFVGPSATDALRRTAAFLTRHLVSPASPGSASPGSASPGSASPG